MFSESDVALFENVMRQELFTAIGETLFMTLVPTILAFLIGLPLGVMLVAGEENGIRPLPKPLMHLANIVINLLRSVPFLILLVVALPLSKAIVGTKVGAKAIILPLTIAAFPFVARLVETSIREVDKGVIEAAQAMGASPVQIIWHVMIPEARPSLISNFCVALITIFGYGAMAGIIGGGGIGGIAITYGYYRFNSLLMWSMVILLVILVQIFQTVGDKITKRCDKRIR